ncbi:hypothetical protein EV363DRAFT_1308112 [Boletus edulis]|uniref:Secreted protein n=1 Tax=Boletus edulis BED1 TaxID=1328754 RepID=A0AAD4GJF3_BOLED|nr:hypothetical protein EV363DRAFT_1308112 [Boletus edulis]KAF8415020.1 hypothetical protein L210DRAFT_3588540 [Boletus edulis BED1]KAF8448846.1 hypothetical protein L210DRAFT_3523280 [Boletus edulis BED1]
MLCGIPSSSRSMFILVVALLLAAGLALAPPFPEKSTSALTMPTSLSTLFLSLTISPSAQRFHSSPDGGTKVLNAKPGTFNPLLAPKLKLGL